MSSAEWIVIFIVGMICGLYGGLIISFVAGWSSLKKIRPDSASTTIISVIVPIRNESAIIERTINLLLSQDYPSSLFELIIVDDHSVDDTLNKINKTKSSPNILSLALPEGLSGKKNAIKYGVQHAHGTLIITTDADCRPGKNWLKYFDLHYRKGNLKMLSGGVSISEPKGLLAKFQSMEFTSLVGSAAGAIGYGIPVMCNGANLAYEKEAFEEVGGFSGNEHIPGGDDIFLLEKFKKVYGGKSIGFIKDQAATVYTDASPGLGDFLNQRIRWVSKSPAYRDTAIIYTALIVLLMNLGMLASLIWAIFLQQMFIVFGVMFLAKCLIDLPLLWKAVSFFGQRKLMVYYIPFQLFYFIFISFSGILGNFLSYRWKGRG